MQHGKTNTAHRTSHSHPVADSPAREFRVVVVGGGPAGLFTAWNLKRKTGSACKIAILEATERLGAKIITRNFPAAGIYEAGVAEIYVYSGLGPDPLRELIEKDLGLQIKHIQGGSCVLDGKLIHTIDDLGEHFGDRTRTAAKAFRAKCAELLTPQAFYKCSPATENQHVRQRPFLVPPRPHASLFKASRLACQILRAAIDSITKLKTETKCDSFRSHCVIHTNELLVRRSAVSHIVQPVMLGTIRGYPSRKALKHKQKTDEDLMRTYAKHRAIDSLTLKSGLNLMRKV